MYIPERYIKTIERHLLGNFLNLESFPLILAIIGEPGNGKTYQLRKYLQQLRIAIHSVNAADLESVRAGEPTKILRDKYIEASQDIEKGIPAILLIDDIDTTLGEWENHTGTVNHQDLLAFLMHIADSPTYIENFGNVKRVPIIFTGNYFDRLYAPLAREGRTYKYDWMPKKEEKIEIIKSIFDFDDPDDAQILIESFPGKPISYFSSLYISERVEQLSNIDNLIVLNKLISDSDYRDELRNIYNKSLKKIDWKEVINKKKEGEL